MTHTHVVIVPEVLANALHEQAKAKRQAKQRAHTRVIRHMPRTINPNDYEDMDRYERMAFAHGGAS